MLLRLYSLDPNVEDEEQRYPRVYFRLRNNLLYYVPGDDRDRLYIPDDLAGEVIGEAHNRHYQGAYRTYDELYLSIYIRSINKKVKEYVEYYEAC